MGDTLTCLRQSLNLLPFQATRVLGMQYRTNLNETGPGSSSDRVSAAASNCSSLSTQTYGAELGLVDPVSNNMTGCGVMSSVWSMIL